jgi:hypothetical protein
MYPDITEVEYDWVGLTMGLTKVFVWNLSPVDITADREVRNENQEIPEKGSNPEEGSTVENPENGFNLFSLLEFLLVIVKCYLVTFKYSKFAVKIFVFLLSQKKYLFYRD